MDSSPTLGLYVSIPFCLAKCTFCNFASDAFGASLLPGYLDALGREVAATRHRALSLGAHVPESVDTVYLGGGTPSLLDPAQIQRLFAALRAEFAITPDAEITVECAPGQLGDPSLEAFVREGVNRLSFGAQSFVPEELRFTGRAHTPEICLRDLERARAAGVSQLSLDLIAGLPAQTASSWQRSLDAVLAAGVDHASVYMLEVDDESRLGREVLNGGSRYGAARVPTDDQCVSFYEHACDALDAAGIAQYEISNFACAGRQSRHNLKYWRRLPYLGFGLDAHSMLALSDDGTVRFHNAGDLQCYLASHDGRLSPRAVSSSALTLIPAPHSDVVDSQPEFVDPVSALAETLFLGLRLNEGVGFGDLEARFGRAALASLSPCIAEACEAGLLTFSGRKEGRPDPATVRLTRRGRALSNEVFANLLTALDDVPLSEHNVMEPAVA